MTCIVHLVHVLSPTLRSSLLAHHHGGTTHDVEVIESTMHEDRQNVVVQYLSQTHLLPSNSALAQWAKNVMGGEWVCCYWTQMTGVEGWVHATAHKEGYWIEVAVNDEWNYVLLRVDSS